MGARRHGLTGARSRQWGLFVDGCADHVHDAAKGGVAHGHGDRVVLVDDFLTADQTFGAVHGDGTDSVFTKVLRHFQHQFLAVVVGDQGVQNRGQVIGELHVNDSADDLRDLAFCICHSGFLRGLERFRARNDFNQLVRDDGLT